MTCEACVKKRTAFYVSRGIPVSTAKARAEQFVASFERQQFRKLKKRLSWSRTLRRILSKLFFTNFRATLLWSLWRRRPIHILLGFNPDYFLDCNGCAAGTCDKVADCSQAVQCRNCPAGTCPSPTDPNSELVSNTCTCTGTAGCTCKVGACTGFTSTCTLTAGTCGYSCIPPYSWNGSACVIVATGKPFGFIFAVDLRPRLLRRIGYA
jgi:hypothetical protein